MVEMKSMRRKTINQLCALAALSVHAPRGLSACVHHITCTVLFMEICVQEDMEVQALDTHNAPMQASCTGCMTYVSLLYF